MTKKHHRMQRSDEQSRTEISHLQLQPSPVATKQTQTQELIL